MSDIDNDLNDIIAEDESESAPTMGAAPDVQKYAPVSAQKLAEVQAEAEKAKKYGNHPYEAAIGNMLAQGTFGASDVLARMAGVPAERLAGVREENPVPATLGGIIGVAAPVAAAVASGGASAALEGAAEAGAVPALEETSALGMAKKILGNTPVGLATKASAGLEESLAGLLKNRVRSKAAQEILAKAGALGAEGALYGEGENIDEAALGKADLSAESMIASAGSGALLGAGFGAVLGGISAAIPEVSKTIEPLASKLKSNIADLADSGKAAQDLFGGTLQQNKRTLARDPEFFNNLPSWVKEHLGFNIGSTPKQLYHANEAMLERTGQELGEINKTLDSAIVANPAAGPSRMEAYQPLIKALDAERSALAPTAEVSGEKLAVIDRFDKLVERNMLKQSPFSFEEYNSLRKNFQSMKWKIGGTELSNNKADIANLLRGEMRKSIDNIADAMGQQNPELAGVGAQLKAANKNYSIASTLEPALYKRMSMPKPGLKVMAAVEAAAAHGLAGPAGLAVAGARKFINTDLRRNLAILADLKRQQSAAGSLLKDSVENFFTKSKKAASSVSLRALMNSGYAMRPDQKAPTNKKEAFQNISNNLTALNTNPDLMLQRLVKSTARVQNAAPNVAAEMQHTLIRGMQFLSSKLPKPVNSGSDTLFPKAYEPSSLEMAKFERYLQVVEHPMSTMNDLERGTLTHEHVEALQAVYPALYQEMQQEVLQQVTAHQDLPYAKKVQMGILLDVPTDESLQPHAIQFLQANFTPTSPQGQPGQAPARPMPAASKVGFSQRGMTDVQQTASRKLT